MTEYSPNHPAVKAHMERCDKPLPQCHVCGAVYGIKEGDEK